MNLFNELPGHVRSPHGLEHVMWRRLPVVALWGLLLPQALALTNRLLTGLLSSSANEKDLALFSYAMVGVSLTNVMLLLALGLGCLIVRVMKGPAYVADAYPIPGEHTGQDGDCSDPKAAISAGTPLALGRE
jgi:hypothetical protein